jgi:hypothetical protein
VKPLALALSIAVLSCASTPSPPPPQPPPAFLAPATGEQIPPPELRPGEPSGLLSIHTSPPVEVYLGDKLLGRVPLEAVPVPVGFYRLRLVNYERGIREFFRIKVAPGQHVRKRLGL